MIKMDNIIKFANEHNYESAEYIGKYKDYNVYNAIYRNDEELYLIGLPAIILERKGKLEWVQNKKSLDILNELFND